MGLPASDPCRITRRSQHVISQHTCKYQLVNLCHCSCMNCCCNELAGCPSVFVVYCPRTGRLLVHIIICPHVVKVFYLYAGMMHTCSTAAHVSLPPSNSSYHISHTPEKSHEPRHSALLERRSERTGLQKRLTKWFCAVASSVAGIKPEDMGSSSQLTVCMCQHHHLKWVQGFGC